MTTTDSLNLIDQVCARFTGTREDHANLIEAIATLRKAVATSAPTNDYELNQVSVEHKSTVTPDEGPTISE